MAAYLLISSRDPFETTGVVHFYDTARDLAAAGNTVTLFLVQNGVFPARRSRASAVLQDVAGAGVEVLADAVSLRERGIPADRLARGVQEAPLDVVIDHLAAGRKAVWY